MSKQHSIQRENFLSFTPSLACHIGVEAAIVVQRVAFLLACPRFGKTIGDHKWIYNTLPAWQKESFPFWSVATIRRIFDSLESMGVLVTCQPAGSNRTKFYRLSEGAYEALTVEALESLPSAQIEHMEVQTERFQALKLSTCYKTEQSTEQSTEKVKGGSGDRTPRTFSDRNPRPIPESDEAMYSELKRLGIDSSEGHDGNFFDQMTKANWRLKGKPVADWAKLYTSRVDRIVEDARNGR